MALSRQLVEFTKVSNGEKFVTLNIKYASRISSELAYELQLKDQDIIKFFKDKNNPEDWFLSIAEKDADGAVIKKRDGRHGFVFYNCMFAKELKKQFKIEQNYFRVKVGEAITIENKKYWPLITAQLYN